MVATEVQPAPAEAITAGPIPCEARKLLLGLVAEWGDTADLQVMEVVRMSGAMTNEVFRVEWNTAAERGPPRRVLLRVYGEEGVGMFFDREDEVRTFEAVSMHGHGPKLLATFPSGRIEEFICARTLSAKDLREPVISGMIATKLREFHELDMPGPRTVVIWDRLRNWLRIAKKLCSLEEAKDLCLDLMEEEISGLEKELAREKQSIGFCHNDLQYGNIMMDEEARLVTIIDYEYASFNPVAFDIANHFCEMAADYHTETPHILDYSKYPDVDERRRFVNIYLSQSVPGEYPENVVEVDSLLEDIEKYALASHLVWGLWGIISEHVNDIEFDYMEYAKQRLEQYWLRKNESLD